MSENINTIINLGLTGAILAIFILYLFLRNFKIVTFIAVAIPISVFSALKFSLYGFLFYELFILVIVSVSLLSSEVFQQSVHEKIC